MSPARAAEAVRLYREDGLSLVRIAMLLDTTVLAVRAALRRAGVPILQRGRRRRGRYKPKRATETVLG